MLPPAPTHPDLVAAEQRLRGHLVSCPVIGDLCLPGFRVPADLRLKAELLQPGGSLWFRGAQHWLLRQFGGAKGIVCAGSPAEMLAWARAARAHRLPAVARPAAAPSERLRAALDALDCAIEFPFGRDAGEVRGPYAGYVPAPLPDAADDFVLGIATVVQELADELPSDTERVVVAPGELTEAIARGVSMLGLPWIVEAAPREHADAAAMAAALRDQHRLCTEAEGAAALAFAVARGAEGTCVLLGV